MQREQFIRAMTRLRACYPQRVADEKHWLAMLSRYFDELGGLDDDVLAEVLEGAWRDSPAFFPGLGELVESYSRRAKRAASEGALLALPEQGQWQGDGASLAREIAADVAQRRTMPTPKRTEAQERAARRRGVGE